MYEIIIYLSPSISYFSFNLPASLDYDILVEASEQAMEVEDQNTSRKNRNTDQIHFISDSKDNGSLVRVGQRSENGTIKNIIKFFF